MIRFSCPQCRSVFEKADEYAGQALTCPTCQAHLRVPGGRPSPPELVQIAQPPPVIPRKGLPRKKRARRYWVLRLFSIGCTIMGILCWLATAIFFLVSCFALSQVDSRVGGYSLVIVLAETFSLFTVGVFYFVVGEAIIVFLDIEENTRRIADQTKRGHADGE